MTTQQNTTPSTVPANPIAELAKQAMLVSVNARCYGARKEDKKISREVAAAHDTDVSSGKYAKNLVPKESLEPVTKAIGALRSFFYDNTQAWLDDGTRVLPSANYETFKTGLEGLKDDYDSAVRGFVDAWPEIKARAPSVLGGMYNAEDYPDDIRSRFGVTVRFMPIQVAGDFRVEIADAERAALQDEITATLQAAQDNAMNELWDRTAVAVKSMAERLRAYKPAANGGKASGIFRDSLVENLRELMALIPRMNFTNDPDLEKIRVDIERDLLGADAGTLRECDSVRGDVADKAADIAARIGEFMGAES